MPAATIGLIEAHGTGTAAGDLAEFSALRHVFGQDPTDRQQIALGSVKSQIGHTSGGGRGRADQSGPGAAPEDPAAHAERHRAKPQAGDRGFAVLPRTPRRGPGSRAETAPPRRAGVSSFGFGGTNFHVVLEEYQQEHAGHYRIHGHNQIILLHAPTPALLSQRCRGAATALAAEGASQHYRELIEASQAASIPREHARLGFVAASVEEAADLLQIATKLLEQPNAAPAWQHPKGIFYRAMGIEPTAKVVALFPGQGSQYLNMGKDLALSLLQLNKTAERKYNL